MVQAEAIRLIKRKYPDKHIEKVTETKNYFLVSVISKTSNDPDVIIPPSYDDGLKAVDKQTKKIFTYNPIRDGE